MLLPLLLFSILSLPFCKLNYHCNYCMSFEVWCIAVTNIFNRMKFALLGGTLDVTVHEVEKGGSVKEVHQVTGGPYGGSKVDEELKVLLMKMFGAQRVEDYQRLFPGDWLVLMNDFEIKKKEVTEH